ncbi:MAG: hypothetical protein HWD58_10960 [Bacteroidota bacterium]|nr:MAG: hypothetical protein HWD58_10960 [Bacteroidota bacterium]
MNVSGTGNVHTSYSAKSTINGNFSMNRTGAGYTALCSNAASISGNFSYTKNVAGSTDIGTLSSKTSIGGTITLNVTHDLNSTFVLHRVQNLTNGGSISINSVKGFNLQQDSLLVTALGITNYGGGEYAYLYNNQITGNVSITTDPSYGGGYATYIRNNTVTRNTVFNVDGSNNFLKAILWAIPTMAT